MLLSELFFFGWRKASKCKKLIKSVQCRLKLLKNKRSAMARILRQDIALLVKIDHYHLALSRVEDLFQDENLVELYDLLDKYCEFLLLNFSYIRKHKDCPNDINEAISSLVYASTRCGNLPELSQIRQLLSTYYRRDFFVSLPGSLINSQIIENVLCMDIAVPYEVKRRMVDEIAGVSTEMIRLSSGSSIFSMESSNDAKESSYSNSSPAMESFIVLNPKDGRIMKLDYSLENSSSLEMIYLDDIEDMMQEKQMIPYQWNNKEEDEMNMKDTEYAMYYKGSLWDLPIKDKNHPSNCKHVHPKLPDYDQLAAKFTAIKRSNLYN
ncbi:vacuolar protein sorting-associated protein IST1-like [Impatiens glandulifera]|uniref:vacuolar protein sorting-associated protein IST1-like n=1 Tax=Impatiens glandulifera TaxID=253017 RepID=UPI001FB0BB8B|nr:vacuolar protein sorting-associated protein IST1-like [Impatiens glandulifera]